MKGGLNKKKMRTLLDIAGEVNLRGSTIGKRDYSPRLEENYRTNNTYCGGAGPRVDDCDCDSGSNCDCSEGGDCDCTSDNCDDC
jgi:hypothetical protein